MGLYGTGFVTIRWANVASDAAFTKGRRWNEQYVFWSQVQIWGHISYGANWPEGVRE